MQDLMPPINTQDSIFHDGDPTTGQLGTIVTALWLNNVQAATRDVQAEIKNVLAKAGMTPDPKKTNQLADAISQIVTSGNYASTAYVDNGLNNKIDKANISGVKGNDNDKVPSLNLFTTETGKLATKAELKSGLDGKQPVGDYATKEELNTGLSSKLGLNAVVQTTGTSTTQVMSQKAVTDLANTKQAAGNYLIRQRVDELPSRGTECAFDGTGNAGWVKGISVGSGDTGQIYVDSRANLYTRFLNNSGAIAEQSIVSVPIGATIIWNTSAPIPDNFWPHEGRSFSASGYPELAKIFPDLKLPDDRGYAIRVADNGRGKDPGRTVGTYQEDQIQNITGSFGAPTIEGGDSSSGAFTHAVSSGSRAAGDGGNSIKFDFDAGRSVRAGDETRMKNVSKILITRVK